MLSTATVTEEMSTGHQKARSFTMLATRKVKTALKARVEMMLDQIDSTNS